MTNRLRNGIILLALLAACSLSDRTYAAPQLISYQGRLSDSNGESLTGNFNLEFFLYEVPVGGASIWSESHVGVNVIDGMFNVILGENFSMTSGLFAGDELYLTIKINGGTETSPRQQFLSVPFAQRVETVDGSSGGTVVGILTVDEGLSVGTGNVLGDSACTAMGVNNSATGAFSSVTGGDGNIASSPRSHIGGGFENEAMGNLTTIGGGYRNTATSSWATVGGGFSNDVSGTGAVIAGGAGCEAIGDYSAICGGNANSTTGGSSVVGGGLGNDCSSGYSGILGGLSNECSGVYSAILGGQGHSVADEYASVVGGFDNTNRGAYSAILGGSNCSITDNLGAPSSYSLIFGDNVDWGGAQRIVGFFDGANHGRFAFNRDGTDGGASYPIHVGTNSANGNGARLTAGGVWTNASSKEFKEDFTPLDQKQLFDAIESLNIEGWNYRNSDEFHIGPYAEEFVEAFGVGTIDEETGERVNTHLAAGDVAGVALAAAQRLISENRQLRAELAQSQTEAADIKSRLNKLEQALEMLAEK